MRVAGLNLLAVLAAAVVIYLIGFVIYGMLIDQATMMAMMRITAEEAAAVGTSRMPFGPLMPLATALGMAVLFQWGSISGWMTGARWGAVIAFASAIPAIWYNWVYGVGDCTLQLVDSAHVLIGHMAAGAILASWK